MFPGSDFYGIKEALLGYARLPTFLPLPVAVQHGWQRFAHTFEASAKPPEIWVWSERLARELESFYPSNKIRVVGSFFYYLLENTRRDLPVKVRQGSICIPPHSSHLARTEYSLERYIELLGQMGSKFEPITIMLYYLDMDEHTVRLYEKAGFQVVSNGTLYDKKFLHNFISHVYDKQFCIYSELGSGVLYASELGVTPVRINVESKPINRGNPYLKSEMFAATARFDEEFLMTMSEATIREEMGKKYVLSPEAVRSLILKNYFTWDFLRTGIRRGGGHVMRRLGFRGGKC